MGRDEVSTGVGGLVSFDDGLVSFCAGLVSCCGGLASFCCGLDSFCDWSCCLVPALALPSAPASARTEVDEVGRTGTDVAGGGAVDDVGSFPGIGQARGNGAVGGVGASGSRESGG